MHIAIDPVPTVRVLSPCRRPGGCPALTAAAAEDDVDRQFLALLAAFRPHGGLWRGAEIVARVPVCLLDAAPIRFAWNAQTWWPWFQFERDGQVLNGDCLAVARELGEDYDGWRLARWFAEPSPWLAAARPVDRLRHDAAAVRAASRADRFVARG